MDRIDHKQIENERLKKLKEGQECLSCEMVVPKDGSPMTILQGTGDNIDFAIMVNCLEEMAKKIKQEFPETESIVPLFRKSGRYKEAYKEIISDYPENDIKQNITYRGVNIPYHI